MKRLSLVVIVAAIATTLIQPTGVAHAQAFWSQWGRDAQHDGMVNVPGQPLNEKIADIIYDPFTEQEQQENLLPEGEAVLTAHYMSTLIDGNSFYMMQKSGSYPSCHPTGWWFYGLPCGPNAWNQLYWSVVRYNWQDNTPVTAWTFGTDWVPEPNGTDLLIGAVGLIGWEPVFHPALANGYLYVPGAAGTVWKVNETTGQSQSHINPFSGNGGVNAANTFVSGPLTADSNGNIYYNVIEFNTNGNLWLNDVVNSWLVKISPNDSSATVTFATLVPNAPPGTSTNCEGTFFAEFGASTLPWPPPGVTSPPTQWCGSQRPGINVGPAVTADGTIYTVSRAHFDEQVAYMIAVNPDLTPKWASSLQYRLTDGCGVLLPIAPKGVNNIPDSCSYGAHVGVDPTTNAYGSGSVEDEASSTPTVLPDGSVVFAATDNYNYGRGHLFHFDTQGNFVNSYTFGWDTTAGVYQHDGTWSLVVKDNHYPVTAYCSGLDSPVCAPPPPGPYYVSQLDADLNVEWSFQNTTIDPFHPNGYEWCVNAPVIDSNGVVYLTSEDGHVYSAAQGHHGVFTGWQQRIFLKEALGAAYTPLSIGDDGKVYTQNDGNLFVVAQ